MLVPLWACVVVSIFAALGAAVVAGLGLIILNDYLDDGYAD